MAQFQFVQICCCAAATGSSFAETVYALDEAGNVWEYQDGEPDPGWEKLSMVRLVKEEE